jgi:hypothetical protein
VTWALAGVNLGSTHARWGCEVTFSFEEVLVEVYKQLFSDNARVVKIGTHRYPIQRSHKGHLRQVDFLFDGHDMRGIEQNPSSNNRWAALVRSGKKVAQFISNGRYIASVVDGKLTRFS